MAIYRKATLHTNDGLVYKFTEYGSSTSCEVFKAPSHIGAELELVDLHDSVTMPTFSRFRKRATFKVLAGMSGANPTFDVAVRYVHGSVEDPSGTRFI
jgi:hypothetical protein